MHGKPKLKRVYAGYYRRYDSKLIYVVQILNDIDTGEKLVICKNCSHSKTNNEGYYVISKACKSTIWSFSSAILRKNVMTNYTSFDQLPLSLCANDVAAVLGISRAGAYTLMRSKGFPTIFIGKRMVVYRDKFIQWMDEQVSAQTK